MQKKSREAANNDNNNKRDNTTNTKIFECYRLSICLTILLLPTSPSYSSTFPSTFLRAKYMYKCMQSLF